MAQPAKILVDYRGGIKVEAGETYSSADLPVTVPPIDIVEFKSETAKVAINGTDAFTIKYGEQIVFDVGSTYTFATDCEVAFGIIVSI